MNFRYLDIRYNDYLDEYVSNVWYHCHEKDFGDLKIFVSKILVL